MKYKIYDVILGKKLRATTEEFKLISRTRLIAQNDGQEITLMNLVRIYKNILKQSGIVTFDNTPNQVINAINDFVDTPDDSILPANIETLLSILRWFYFDLFIVGRSDMQDADTDKIIEVPVFSYLIDNYTDNNIGISGFYTGISKNYDGQRMPLAYDYLGSVINNNTESRALGFDNVDESFDILSKSGALSSFDDSTVKIYFKNKSFRYVVFYV